MKSLKQLIFEGLMQNGEGSEKRQTKFAVVIVMLGLTITDYIINRKIHTEVWLMWFGLIGWDGARGSYEKKVKMETDSKPTELTKTDL
jgi:hypothetical protein